MEKNKKPNTHPNATHGMSRSIEYSIWSGIIDRTTNKNGKYWHRYGGAGIGISDSWLKFENFYRDMGKRPSPRHSIDRIDNNKGYSKVNCRWATRKQQCRNRRSNTYMLYDGRIKTLAAWAEEFNICPKLLRSRLLRLNWPIEKALTLPKGKAGVQVVF